MIKYSLRGQKDKAAEATFVYNDANCLIEFSANTITEPSALNWLLQHLPITVTSIFDLRDRYKFGLYEVPLDITFETFWNTYDFKMGSKKKCEKLYNALNDADKTLAIAKIAAYKRYLKLNEGIKQVYPERYISDERYLNSF